MRLWRKRQPAPATRALPRISAGKRVYAIGDVHGRLDLLHDLLTRIQRDNASRSHAEVELVMLGDLIDRGPQSAQVVEFLLSERPSFARFHFIQGNHEEAMLRSLEAMADPRKIGWLDFGGRETMASYGAADAIFERTGWQLSDALRRHVPAAHIAFLASFDHQLSIGDYLFVHAGIRPGVALDQQKISDMHWIRADFLENESDHGFTVVHGHTISEQVEFRTNRIGIDTGAYRTGILTAIGLEDEGRWLIATEAETTKE